jgi:hypothetical protein
MASEWLLNGSWHIYFGLVSLPPPPTTNSLFTGRFKQELFRLSLIYERKNKQGRKIKKMDRGEGEGERG